MFFLVCGGGCVWGALGVQYSISKGIPLKWMADPGTFPEDQKGACFPEATWGDKKKGSEKYFVNPPPPYE